MDVEHIVRSFPVDENLERQVKELEAQGYQLIPGIPPVMVYHLARPKQQSAERGGQALGKMTIDESKIFIMPAGERKQ